MKNNKYMKSLEQNETLDLFLGRNGYFIPEEGTNDHWVLGAWKNHIIPALNHSSEETLINNFRTYLTYILSSEDNTKTLENLIYNLHVFFYLKTNGDIDIDPDFIFEMGRKIEDYVNKNMDQKESWLNNILKVIRKNSDYNLFIGKV